MAKSRGIRKPYRLLTPTERAEVRARLAAGELVKDIAAWCGASPSNIKGIRRAAALSRRREGHSPHRLSFVERERISRGVAAGESGRAIARALGRSPSTVCREIKAGGGCKWYRAINAERRSGRRALRPKLTKLAQSPRLVAEVEVGLLEGWSPQQISARLRVKFPDDLEMRISHETIYLSLYVQSRGELRRRLSSQLRTGRSTRKPHSRAAQKSRIRDMVNISERPGEVADRAVPGHWEGDLILGSYSRSAVATLVERQTRFVMLAYLGNDHTTDRVIDALKTRIVGFPEHLLRSLTWDQGTEMTAHKRFTIDTGVQIYFCDPRSPWQRGSNENTNGLLRQYLPKGTDLAVHDQAELDRIAARLNGRPRQTLGWMNPAEKMAELISTSPS